jgi:hypothetical protein
MLNEKKKKIFRFKKKKNDKTKIKNIFFQKKKVNNIHNI